MIKKYKLEYDGCQYYPDIFDKNSIKYIMTHFIFAKNTI